MITFLRGQIVEKTPVAVIIDVGGVGYEVFIPLSTYEALPDDGREVMILTRQIIREDAHHLYGFVTEQAREIFDLLISISGIGPRLALAVLSGMSVEEFARAVRERNETALTVIPGIGKKTAGRVVLELAEKIGRVAVGTPAGVAVSGLDSSDDEQVITALLALGLNRPEAAIRLGRARARLGTSRNIEELIKTALHM
jgi:Holliday junction DNA helicase RuvA